MQQTDRTRIWGEELAALEGEVRRCLEHLRDTLPLSDLDSYPFPLFAEFAEHAAMLRGRVPWCMALDEDVFLEYVLCPRINDEDLSAHRKLFYGELYPRLQGLHIEEAVLEINRWAHEVATYQAQDDRTASPLTVYRNGSGRCGEESAFVAAALRSVGIAARQVYAPRWSHCNDNHAWVEALCDGTWRFLGACEPEPVLDKGWFNAAAARAILVHSRRFLPGEGTAVDGTPLGWDGGVAHYNQTARYAPTKGYTFRVLRNGRAVAGALLRLQILNEARLITVAVLETGAEGSCTVELGIGDLYVTVHSGDETAEKLCHGAEADSVVLELTCGGKETGDWWDFDFHAPVAPGQAGPVLSWEQKRERAAVLEAGSARRNARIEGFFDRERAEKHPEMADILRLARGNFNEVISFLGRDANPLRERLLRALRHKDLRDCTAPMLEEHLILAEPYAGQYPDSIFDRYLLSPRIADEPLTSWRRPLQAWVEEKWPDDSPRELWEKIGAAMERQEREIHPGLFWPPEVAAAKGRCDARSLAVLFVAALRAKGIPARLREMDGVPQYWQDGGFCDVSGCGQGEIVFAKEPEQRFRYHKNWGLARLEGEDWLPLQLPDDGWEGDVYTLPLPAGVYRVLTSVRLPGGNQFASVRVFSLAAGEVMEIPLRLRSYRIADILVPRELPGFEAMSLEGAPLGRDSIGHGGRPSLLFWLEEGAEPTEHILNELYEAAGELEKLPVDLYFFLRGRESLAQATLASLLARLPGIRVGVGEWDYTLENMARQLYCDPERPPLTVACDSGGRAVYATSGYNVSAVQLLLQILGQLGADHFSGTSGGDTQ